MWQRLQAFSAVAAVPYLVLNPLRYELYPYAPPNIARTIIIPTNPAKLVFLILPFFI
jgi:hypothetical protein